MTTLRSFILLSVLGTFSVLRVADASGNLFANSDFSETEAGMPVAWPLSGVTDPENYRVNMQHDIMGEPNVVQMRTDMAETSRYIAQERSVEPGGSYEWRARIYQVGGRGLMWAVGLNDADGQPVSWETRNYLSSYIGHALYPDFVSGEVMRGSGEKGWRTETLKFQVPDNVVKMRFSIGVYFAVGDLRIGSMELVRLSDESAAE